MVFLILAQLIINWEILKEFPISLALKHLICRMNGYVSSVIASLLPHEWQLIRLIPPLKVTAAGFC